MMMNSESRKREDEERAKGEGGVLTFAPGEVYLDNEAGTFHRRTRAQVDAIDAISEFLHENWTVFHDGFGRQVAAALVDELGVHVDRHEVAL